MKAEVKISEGFTEIILKAENAFERNLVESFEREQIDKTVTAKARTDSEMYSQNKKNHRIYIDFNHTNTV
jgi:hypothetical protein